MGTLLPVVHSSDISHVNGLALTNQLRALAEPNRLRIVAMLREGERCVCEIESSLGLSQSLVSNHLRVLRRVGLVEARRDTSDARWIYYRLNPNGVEQLLGDLSHFLHLSDADSRPAACTPDGRPV